MPKATRRGYWQKRKDSIYLFAARQICAQHCPEPRSVIDVGSNNTPTLEWHRDSATRLVSLDLRRPYIAPGVDAITSDLLTYEPDQPFDLVTCFQVVEHVPNAHPFAKKLVSLGRTLVVSVPYKWRKGKCKWHVHDPVDEEKMFGWFERPPDFQYVATELNRVRRLIQVYKLSQEPSGEGSPN